MTLGKSINNYIPLHKIKCMRTTLDIPAELLKEAIRITKAKTKSEAIGTALEMVIKTGTADEAPNILGEG